MEKLEIDLPLDPGSMLLFDDTRVVHGRMGKRKEGEVIQFLIGIKNAQRKDIRALRKFLSEYMT